MLDRSLGRAYRFSRCCSTLGVRNAWRLYGPHGAHSAHVVLPDGKSFQFRRGTSDRDVLLSIFVNREYPSFKSGAVSSILDAGANVGCASRWWLRFHPGAFVVAVEPDHDNFAILRGNLAPYAHQAALIHGAVWHSNTTLSLTTSARGTASFRVADDGGTAIKTYTIDELATRTPSGLFDIVKLDIEGAEREVFAGSTGQRWLDTAQAVIVEVHEDYSPGAAKQMARAFADRDYSLLLSGENLVWIRTPLYATLRREG